jgi:hypothetical protein
MPLPKLPGLPHLRVFLSKSTQSPEKKGCDFREGKSVHRNVKRKDWPSRLGRGEHREEQHNESLPPSSHQFCTGVKRKDLPNEHFSNSWF